MSEKIVLTAYETELLKLALPYAGKLEAEGEVMTRDGLRRELSCGKDIASRLKQYIKESKALVVAERLKAIPERAETRAEVNVAIGVPVGTSYSHVVRENVRLQRALAKAKYVAENEKEVRVQEAREEIEQIKVEKLGNRPSKEPAKKDTGLMLEVSLFDHHFGKLAWPSETTGRPYDVKIAEATFMRALEQLLERSKGFRYDQVLFIVGQDIFHSNDIAGNTANGTRLDTEGRFQKTYWTVRKLLCRAIERLKQIAPVKVLVVVGNHDKLSAWTLGDSIDCWFHDDPKVSVDNAPTYRKYFQFGKVLLMFTHGDLGKREDFPLLMATEQPKAFGETLFRETHTGHLHTTKNQEWHGVRVRTLPALCPADAWHHENAYVGSLRIAEAFVWSREEGLIAQFFHNDDAFPVIETKTEVI
jgi:hypothetical protein